MEKIPYIGQKDRRIKIQSQVETRNVVGGVVTELVLIAEVFAYCKELSGGEDVEGKVRHHLNRSYTIRYQKELFQNLTKYKIEDAGTLYEVEHVKMIGRNNHIEIIVKHHE